MLGEQDFIRNNITEIPDFFPTLKQLKWVDLSFNQITKLPEALKEMNLQTLNIVDNPLEDIPECLLGDDSFIRTNLLSPRGELVSPRGMSSPRGD